MTKLSHLLLIAQRLRKNGTIGPISSPLFAGASEIVVGGLAKTWRRLGTRRKSFQHVNHEARGLYARNLRSLGGYKKSPTEQGDRGSVAWSLLDAFVELRQPTQQRLTLRSYPLWR
jgi:hypothetical protein